MHIFARGTRGGPGQEAGASKKQEKEKDSNATETLHPWFFLACNQIASQQSFSTYGQLTLTET
jgi:hypothetical protein